MARDRPCRTRADDPGRPSAEWRRASRRHISKAALAVLKRMKARGEEFVFPSREPGKPLSHTAMISVLERMSRADITVEGFRSTFREWAASRTNFPACGCRDGARAYNRR